MKPDVTEPSKTRRVSADSTKVTTRSVHAFITLILFSRPDRSVEPEALRNSAGIYRKTNAVSIPEPGRAQSDSFTLQRTLRRCRHREQSLRHELTLPAGCVLAVRFATR